MRRDDPKARGTSRMLAAVLVPAALVLVPLPASAAPDAAGDPVPTHFEFSVAPTDVGVDHGPVTYQGRLVADEADGAEHPVPGLRVVISDGRDQWGTATTDAEGRFAGSSPAHRTGTVYAWTQGSREYKGGFSDKVPITVAKAETRLSVAPAPTPQAVGDTAELAGKLERRTSTGDYVPFGGQPVRVWEVNTGIRTNVYTKADGTYRYAVRMPVRPLWSLSFEPDGQSFTPAYASYGGNITLPYRTVIQGLTVTPTPVVSGQNVTLKGTAVRQGLDGPETLVDGTQINAEFSPDGKTWQFAAASITNPDTGTFNFTARAYQAGYWRAAVKGDSYSLPSVSTGQKVAVKYRTRFSAFNAAPEPVRKGKTITVTGSLERDMTGWKRAGAGAAINIYFQAKGSTARKLITVVKTDSKGAFRKGFTASKDGTYLATYSGSTTYVGSTAPGDYVDVR
ncbi:hypothetical protein [Actinomadura fibrosa]|uniref:Carboxypeptidase regulatory-like domain-containing protein n=1 Tax=Actinomadura fibrosa TaxID=111802 RepID=A0ABW2XDP1_9ACTN|nr:hypothetical protein [Actinomadura fibrosa]